MGAFEDFVNTELPLRTNVAVLPTASRYPRFTGVGRTVEERTPAEVRSDLNVEDGANNYSHQAAYQWYLEYPKAGDKYVLCKVPVAATIKRVNHIAIGAGSSADFNIDIRSEATPETGGTEIWNADKTVNPTHSIETTFDNDGIAQYGILVVLIEAVGGTVPDRIWIGLVLEYD